MSNASAASEPNLQLRLIEAMHLHVQGKLDDAQDAYEALLAEYPGQPDILHALGTICLQTQAWDKAAEYFRRALNANPDEPRHMLPLARALAAAGKAPLAMDALVQLLKLERNHEEGQAMLHDLCLPEAKAQSLKNSAIDRLIAANPQAAGLHAVAIRLSRTLGDHAARLRHFEALYRGGQRGENLYHEYGKALKDNGQFERGLAVLQEGLAAHPESLPLLRLRADFYLSLGDYARAMEDGLKIISLAPDDHYARTSIGSIKLLTSDGREGYEEYAAHRDYELSLSGVSLPIPEWRGEKLHGKRLLVWSSQGIGDVIMFASLLPWVLAQGARVTLAVYPKLIPLFARSFPDVRMIPYEAEALLRQSRDCEAHVILGKLMPHVLPHYVPAQHPPFLKADAARVKILRGKYLAGGAKKLVGISWHTSNSDTFSQRNIPLEQWRALFELPQVQYVSLQYGDHAAEIEAVNRRFPGALLADAAIDAFHDVDALAAQIAAMDEVVSIQNSTVHLAGALGVKTTLMLSAASEWRWGLARTDSRWYQSVTIERQEKLLDWQPVLSRVRDRMIAVDALVKRLGSDPDDKEAQDRLHDLCLPDAKAHGIKGSEIERLIDTHPKVIALRLVAVKLCRTLDERVERLRHLEAMHRHGIGGEDFYWEYAAMLNYNGQYERCMTLCEEALAAYPEAAELYRVRAAIHGVRGEHAGALEDYARVLALKPGDIQARAMAGIIKFLVSDLTEGFEEYAAVRDRVVSQCKLTIAIPEWRGEPLEGKRLLIWCNEGVGDIIMFASLLPWVLEQDAQVTLAVYPKLFPLFARSFSGMSVVSYNPEKSGEAQRLFASYENRCDVQIAFSQLMARALPHYTPSQHPPFLKADAARAAVLREKYLALSPSPKKLVGISWHSVNQDTASQRNIPLEQWQKLFELPNVQYVSLQYGGHAAEIEEINRRFPGVLHADPDIDGYSDMDALVAQIRACDEVVSIQNVTVHLAGALGVKTTLMLSAASDWRWGLNRADSRWYESVHIERQEKLLDWQPVLARVRDRSFAVEYAVLLSQSGQFRLCLELCEKALAAAPGSPGWRRLRAIALGSLGRRKEALEEWSWVAARMAEDPAPRAAIGILKLLTSDCRDGFEEFSALRDKMIARYHLRFSIPEWRGELLAGKRLLLWCNEGVGDIVMFAGFLPWIMGQGARVTLVLYPKLIPLFARSFPEINIVPFNNEALQETLAACARDCDFQLATSQLPALGLPHYTPSQHPPYLKADAARTKILREKYLAGRSKKLVGISWHTAHKDNSSQRNIALEQWRPLFDLPDIQYMSLQYGDHAAEIDEINRRFPGALLADAAIDGFHDTDALAAQMQACDEVVSIQNATVHLAGALGIKTTIMLCAASDWRWGLERTDSRWYSSVTIERQSTLMEWKPVLMRVRDRLKGAS